MRALPFAVLLLSAPAWAGPPFVTDDPVPIEYGTWEINNALVGTLVRGGATAGIPSIDVNYGILPGVQLHIQPQLAAVWGTPGRFAGPGDTQFGTKIRLIDEDSQSWTPMVSLYPIYTAPTGNARHGLGTGHGSTFLPVWADKTLGNWIIDGGFGYSINPGAQGRNAWFAGGLLLYKVTSALQLGSELFLQTAQQRGAKDACGFNIGGSYDISPTYHVLFSVGQGLMNRNATNRLSFYFAVQTSF